MASERTRAGSRKAKFRSTGVGFGRLSPHKWIFLRTLATQQLSVHAYEPSEIDEVNGLMMEAEEGLNFVLMIPIPGRRWPLSWNFSNMTLQELEATRQFFNHLFDLAEPVVRQRDKVAADAEAQGDDTYSRIYRPLPQLIVREGQIRAYDQGVHNGSEDVSSGAGDGGDPSGGVRGDGDELADRDEVTGGSQDDEPQAD